MPHTANRRDHTHTVHYTVVSIADWCTYSLYSLAACTQQQQLHRVLFAIKLVDDVVEVEQINRLCSEWRLL